MPSYKKIHEASTGFTFPFGDETINLRAYLERIGSPEYRKLETRELELNDQSRALVGKIQGEIDTLQGLNRPSDAEYLEFRQFFEDTVVGLRADLEQPWADALSAINATLATAEGRLQEFNTAILPTEEQIKAREKKVEEALKKIRAQIAEINEKIKANHAERLALLLQSWDITNDDAENSTMWEINKENLLTFSGALLKELLEATEKKVTGRSLSQ